MFNHSDWHQKKNEQSMWRQVFSVFFHMWWDFLHSSRMLNKKGTPPREDHRIRLVPFIICHRLFELLPLPLKVKFIYSENLLSNVKWNSKLCCLLRIYEVFKGLTRYLGRYVDLEKKVFKSLFTFYRHLGIYLGRYLVLYFYSIRYNNIEIEYTNKLFFRRRSSFKPIQSCYF